MQVQFAVIDSDPLKLDKRGDFLAASPTIKTVQVASPINTENPHFLLDIPAGFFDYNYAYVPAWNKYYFLSEPVFIDGNRLTISCVCDVLTTNADGIKALSINLHRSTTAGNSYLSDNMRPTQSNRQCESHFFHDCRLLQNAESYNTDIVYVLSVQGGAHR